MADEFKIGALCLSALNERNFDGEKPLRWRGISTDPGAPKLSPKAVLQFGRKIRRLAASNQIVRMAGVAGYAQSVLVLELAYGGDDLHVGILLQFSKDK